MEADNYRTVVLLVFVIPGVVFTVVWSIILLEKEDSCIYQQWRGEEFPWGIKWYPYLKSGFYYIIYARPGLVRILFPGNWNSFLVFLKFGIFRGKMIGN